MGARGGPHATTTTTCNNKHIQYSLFIDNQEVYQDCAEETGAVLVIEILEYQKDITNKNACSFFLKDLADANEALSGEQCIHNSRVLSSEDGNDKMELGELLSSLSMPTKGEDVYCHVCLARGSQKVIQGKAKDNTTSTTNNNANNNAAHWIDVELCALRLRNVDTDLLITLSIPRTDTIMGEEEEMGVGSTAAGAVVGEEQYSDVFRKILASFNIRDWSLFG